MSLLLLGLWVLIGGGLLAALAGRSARLANLVGAATAVAGSAIALIPVVGVLVRGTSLPEWSWVWSVPFGSFTVGLDPLSAWFAAAILGLAILAAVYGAGYLVHDADRKSLGPPWLFFNLLVAAMLLVVTARNGMLFLVAWEGMALASFFLVTFEDEQSSVREAGRIYLIASHLGAACLLLFFASFAAQAESLDFSRLAAAAAANRLSETHAGVLFLLALVGFGAKAGFMPLHVWLPEAHPAAPSHVSALMSGVMIKTGIYGLLRAWTLLGTPPAWWGWVLVAIGLSSGVLGVLFALAQHDLKRLLAYHSVENIGIIALGLGVGLLGLSAGSPTLAVLGFGGGLLHVLNHALFKGLLFLGAGAVLHGAGTLQQDQLGGLLKRMPATGAAFLVGAVAICGLPPLNGFVSEFLIYLSAFQAFREASLSATSGSVLALATIGGLALIGGLAAACFTKSLGIVFLGEPRTKAAAEAHAPPWLMTGPLLVLAAGCLIAALAVGPLLAGLAPVLAVLLHEPSGAVAESLAPALGPLNAVVSVGVIAIVLMAGLTLLRKRLLGPREVRDSGTWDCGYAAPTSRMQYTSTSFVQPLTDFFQPVLRCHKHVHEPRGLFPDAASARTHHEDLFLSGLFSRSYRGVSWVLSRLHWLQHGRLNLYVLYIALTLVALLAWEFGLGELLDQCAAWLAARQTMLF
ncbi:MAG TPA: proton-conducting transporter membrane subunit [Candidatus Anammoximicrobium sp.]|nr:proton-conducting transporter membrane subunit [Candidatus Anammoximicrobium sp.]